MTSRQETRSGRRWILVALLVFILCLVLWIAAALILNIAFAESLPFSLNLRSRLAANYAPDDFVGSLGIFRLSIIDEVLLDRGLSPEEAEEQSEKIRIAMGSPVPTATARDFKGNEPFTATPEDQLTSTVIITPTETPTPTNTLFIVMTTTDTSVPASETPAVPSKTPTFGPSPAPTECFVDPFIEVLYPPDGAVYTLADEIPAQAFAYDPDNVDPDTCQPVGVYPSDDGEGIDKVEFEFYWVDGGDVLVHSQEQFWVKYCGFTGSPNCDDFPVSSPSWPPVPSGAPISNGLHKMKVRAWDNEGASSDWVEVYFTLNLGAPATDTPTPTPTYTAVNTSTSTPTPTHTSTPTPTYTPTNTPTATPTPTPTNTPTPTTDVCTLITITGFDHMSDEVWWTITNGSSTAITIVGININWPGSNGELNQVRWNGPIIWDDAWTLTPPAIINSGWTGESRIIDPGQSSQLRFSFDNPTSPSGYALVVTFDNGCMPSKND